MKFPIEEKQDYKIDKVVNTCDDKFKCTEVSGTQSKNEAVGHDEYEEDAAERQYSKA